MIAKLSINHWSPLQRVVLIGCASIAAPLALFWSVSQRLIVHPLPESCVATGPCADWHIVARCRLYPALEGLTQPSTVRYSVKAATREAAEKALVQHQPNCYASRVNRRT